MREMLKHPLRTSCTSEPRQSVPNPTKHQEHHRRNPHPNYEKPRMQCDLFTLKHFAGNVTYDVAGFLEKNNDSLQVQDRNGRCTGRGNVHFFVNPKAKSKGPRKSMVLIQVDTLNRYTEGLAVGWSYCLLLVSLASPLDGIAALS